jgi:hypothetical protein
MESDLMPKDAKIDLILHRDGAECMIHSARTDFNVALAPTTTKVSISPLEAARGRIEGSLNGGEKLRPSDLEEIGCALSEVLFAGTVRQLYDAAANGSSVQLSLCVTDPGLKGIPWEFLLWPDLNAAPHRSRSVCRLVTGTSSRPPPSLSLDGGVRIMLVVSQPSDQPAVEWIETKRTMETLIAATTPPVGFKAMEFKLCEASDTGSVRTEVQAFDPHVVHFIGHGAPNALVFTKHQTSKSHHLSAAQVHNVLSSRSTRLVVLSACDTANVGSDIKPLVPIAERMVQAGVPAVVANQMPISLRSIHSFCGSLYSELLKSGNIDWAVNAGRIAMGVAFDSLGVAAVEWGVPVLYRRSGCSQLFSVKAKKK